MLLHEKAALALAGVAQWMGRQPENHKVTWFDSQSGHAPGLWARSPAEGM